MTRAPPPSARSRAIPRRADRARWPRSRAGRRTNARRPWIWSGGRGGGVSLCPGVADEEMIEAARRLGWQLVAVARPPKTLAGIAERPWWPDGGVLLAAADDHLVAVGVDGAGAVTVADNHNRRPGGRNPGGRQSPRTGGAPARSASSASARPMPPSMLSRGSASGQPARGTPRRETPQAAPHRWSLRAIRRTAPVRPRTPRRCRSTPQDTNKSPRWDRTRGPISR